MDIARLITAAEETQRRLYASLPWGYRVAQLFMVLSLDTTESFGRAIMAEFLLKGVTGMPDPGPRWNASSKKPADTLPRGYGRDFADRVYKTLLGKFRDPDLAENAMMDFLIRFTLQGGSSHMHPGTSFDQAKQYVMQGVVRQGINIVQEKTRQRQREKPTYQQDDEGEEQQIDFSDPHAFEDLADLIPQHQLKALLADLSRKVHPDAGLYIKLLTEGYNEKEIVGDPAKGIEGKLPHYNSSPQSWNANWKPKILKYLQERVEHGLQAA